MLGVGGAVVLLPLLTAFAGLTLKEATNITVVQVMVSSLIGWLSFRRGGLVGLLAITLLVVVAARSVQTLL